MTPDERLEAKAKLSLVVTHGVAICIKALADMGYTDRDICLSVFKLGTQMPPSPPGLDINDDAAVDKAARIHAEKIGPWLEAEIENLMKKMEDDDGQRSSTQTAG